MTTPFNFFPFSWHYNDEEIGSTQQCIIRIFGWNEKNESVCVRINDFTIPVEVELPSDEEWTEGKRAIVGGFLRKFNKYPKMQPIGMRFERKEKLYYSNAELNEQTGKYARKKYPVLIFEFKTVKAAESFVYFCKEAVKIPELGNKEFKFVCHASSRSITPVLKCMAKYKLPSSAWMRGKGRLQAQEAKESTKTHEYHCSCKDLSSHPSASSFPIVYPRVCSWDIETYSSDENSMPKFTNPEDKVFLISCVTSTVEKNKETGKRERNIKKYCLSIVDVDNTKVDKDTTVIVFKSEYHLLMGFKQFINDHDIDVLIGYNIMGYDLKYVLERADLCSCKTEFMKMGAIPGKPGRQESINWGSSARGKQDMVYIEAEGRVWLDMLPYIRMNNNFSNYKLTTVCKEILQTEDKDDLKIKDMFRYYREKDPVGLALAVNYCTQDSNVVLKLWEKCLVFFDITETATTCCVPPFFIVAKAQQIRIVSQMLTYCYHHNILLESNIHKAGDNEFYEGATVTDPIAGLYKNVVPFDFASLYPSIIQAYNIDYTTLVNDETIPDEDCHVLKWETHMACSCPKSDGSKPKRTKDGRQKIICATYKYRWLKHTTSRGYKGVIPTLIKNLIDARKNTREIIAKNKSTIKTLKQQEQTDDIKKQLDNLYSLNDVLDKRQAAFKVSANSMYGIMGAAAGYIPFLAGAMSVTKIGRDSIMKASTHLEKEYGGKVIYNDTDSAYTIFPSLNSKSMEELWKYVNDVAEDIKKLFLAPMKLEFEGKVYSRFLIFSKKRYVGLQSDEKGKIDDKWKISGIVLKRRDNCKVLKDCYQHMIEFVLNHADELTKLTHIQDYHKLRVEYKKEKTGITQKKRRENGDINTHLVEYEQKIREYESISRGNQTVRELMNIFDTYVSDMFLTQRYKPIDFIIVKGLTKDTYAAKTLPPHVAVANKMKARNIIVQQNDRIEYVLIDRGCKPGSPETQDVKAEDYAFQQEYSDWIKVDYLYYLEKQIINPVEQIFEVACGVHNFAEESYTYRYNKKMLNYAFKQLCSPILHFEEATNGRLLE